MMKKCAVVILNWCGEKHLRRFLPSVVEFTPNWADIIVADNGSNDNSLVEIARFERAKPLVLDKNYGFAEGYNRALAQIEGSYEFYVLLNSDVEVGTKWLEPLIEQLEADKTIAATAPKILSLNEREKFESAGAAGGFIDYLGYPFCRGRIVETIEADEGQYNDAREVFWASGAAFCVRAEIFHSLGGFDADYFAHMEEIDLCWRMQLKGYRIFVQPESQVYHLGGGSLAVGSPHKTFLNHRNNLAMLFKCAPWHQRLSVALLRPFLDLLTAFGYGFRGRWDSSWAVFRAWKDFLAWHGALIKKRSETRSDVVRESKQIFRGSILLNYIFGKKRFRDLSLKNKHSK